jgi:hypothetical protein
MPTTVELFKDTVTAIKIINWWCVTWSVFNLDCFVVSSCISQLSSMSYLSKNMAKHNNLILQEQLTT